MKQQDIKKHYKKLYKQKDVYHFGTRLKKKILDLIVKKLKRGAIIDLGSGEGADIHYLASKGFEATAVDLSKDALEKLKELAKSDGLKIKTIVADLDNFQVESTYDGIISFLVLQHLSKNRQKFLIENIKEKTRKGGINAISVFRRGDDSEGKWKDQELFKDAELKKYYSDWNILFYNESERLDKAHGKPHTHKIAEIVAEKK